jgi:hypothetical protein
VCHISDHIHCFELLLALAKGGKKYMQIALKFGFEQLVRNFDCVRERLETMEQGQRPKPRAKQNVSSDDDCL